MGVKSAALRFSRATDNFRSVEWRETVVSVGACCCGRRSPKIDCESPCRCAARARPSGEQCGTPRPYAGPAACSGHPCMWRELLPTGAQRSVLRWGIEQDRNFIGGLGARAGAVPWQPQRASSSVPAAALLLRNRGPDTADSDLK